jgi:hypothetical protein
MKIKTNVRAGVASGSTRCGGTRCGGTRCGGGRNTPFKGRA